MTTHEWASVVARRLGPLVHEDGVYALLWIERTNPLIGYAGFRTRAVIFMKNIDHHPYQSKQWDFDKVYRGLFRLLPPNMDIN